MANESTRSKMIRESGVDEDMSPIKRMVKSMAYGASRMADKVGMTQEKEYADKSKEDMKPKGYKRGGMVMAKKSAAKPMAKKPMTKGYACGGKVMKKAAGRGR